MNNQNVRQKRLSHGEASDNASGDEGIAVELIDDILVQVDPLPAVEQDAYTVPNLQKTRVYGFDACNTSAAADKIRFAFARKGAAVRAGAVRLLRSACEREQHVQG